MHALGPGEHSWVGLELPVGREWHPKCVEIAMRRGGCGLSIHTRSPVFGQREVQASGLGRMIRKINTKLNFSYLFAASV
jgi:hypothetical protein